MSKPKAKRNGTAFVKDAANTCESCPHDIYRMPSGGTYCPCGTRCHPEHPGGLVQGRTPIVPASEGASAGGEPAAQTTEAGASTVQEQAS